MKAILPTCALLTVCLASQLYAEEESPSPTPDPVTKSGITPMPLGMKGNYETLEATIEKVYSVERNGFKWRAYVVKWNDQEVVISDMMALSEKNAGDKLTFMVQELEIPLGSKPMKMIQFMAMDMEGLKGLGTEMLKTGDSTTPAATPAGEPQTP